MYLMRLLSDFKSFKSDALFIIITLEIEPGTLVAKIVNKIQINHLVSKNILFPIPI